MEEKKDSFFLTGLLNFQNVIQKLYMEKKLPATEADKEKRQNKKIKWKKNAN